MSISHTQGTERWEANATNSCQTPRLSSHAVHTIDPITPDTEETEDLRPSGAPADRGDPPFGRLETARCVEGHITSHQLHSVPSTPSPSKSPACPLPSLLWPTGQCLQLPATSLRAQNPPVRPESPGVVPHLLARAARCASPSLRSPECASTADTSPSLGLRALVGTVHATHRKTYSAAAVSCNSADKLLPSYGKALPTGLRTCSPRPPMPPAASSPSVLQSSSAGVSNTTSEQPQALLTGLNPARLHLDPAALAGAAPRPHAFLSRRRSRSNEHMHLRSSSRASSPALLHLAQSDATTGAHGDALGSACGLGRMKPARARRNTRVRVLSFSIQTCLSHAALTSCLLSLKVLLTHTAPHQRVTIVIFTTSFSPDTEYVLGVLPAVVERNRQENDQHVSQTYMHDGAVEPFEGL